MRVGAIVRHKNIDSYVAVTWSYKIEPEQYECWSK